MIADTITPSPDAVATTTITEVEASGATLGEDCYALERQRKSENS
jgi:hypothetical protein